MPEAGDSKRDGFVAKAAGVAVVSGIAWSILKSFTSSTSPPLSTSSPSLDADGHKHTYHVSQGDTLFSISQRFGISMEGLKAANNLHGDDIFAGDQLVITK